MFTSVRSLEERLKEVSMDEMYSRLEWPLFPTLRDLLPGRRRKNLPVNKVKGAYSSSEEYLQTHLQLLSEDFMRTLNEQVNDYRSTGRTAGRIFKIRFGETERELSHYPSRVRRAITWLDGIQVQFVGNDVHLDDDDRRFMFGSLLLFSNDNFKTMMFGIVKGLSPLHLDSGRSLRTMMVRMISCLDEWGEFLTGCSSSLFLMMESQAFYYPYLHVTRVLEQDMTRVPFEEEIVYGQVGELPSYLRATDVHLFTKVISGSLTSSQLSALQSVFSHRVALVQGPPGTGKTYLGSKIVEILVKLRKMRRLSAPILVITTTQHTVDEFLKRCRAFTDKAIHAHGLPHATHKPDDFQAGYNLSFRMSEKLDVMKRADVIVMTTSRAAYIYERYLESLSIKIVVVEEAAEALEAFVMAGVPLSAEHLILLGDHKQLCPSTANYELGAKHKLSLSIMERLVNNGFDCPMLMEQRRMRPEISRLISHIYPGLKNHPVTEGRPHINGMRKDVFFVTHNEEESQDRDNPSYYNTHEAVMVVKLCQYLLTRGHSAEDITILTTYNRQLTEVKKYAEGTRASTVRASVVDNFQGEESKIILLSLVRSNSRNSVGFLKKENRVCVALSRARDGLYVFANLPCLVASSAEVWGKVMNVLSELDLFGKRLPLICPHGRSYDARSVKDLEEATVGCVMCELGLACRKAAAELRSAQRKLASMEATLAKILEGKGEKEDDEKYQERVERAIADEVRATTAVMLATAQEERAKRRFTEAKDLLDLNRISLITDTKQTVEMLLVARQAEHLSII